MSFFTIRPVTDKAEDLHILARFCVDLAAHDGYKIEINARELGEQLFFGGTNVRAFFGERDRRPIGFVMFYEAFTSYGCQRGLYIPGIYVEKEYQRLGYGIRLYRFVARYALDHGFQFISGVVESHNEMAKDLYKKAGAVIYPGWSYCTIGREDLEKAAAMSHA
ncbi:MAG: GNAT family N-acetyltransferase [Alphaproteobacteria bacterium]